MCPSSAAGRLLLGKGCEEARGRPGVLVGLQASGVWEQLLAIDEIDERAIGLSTLK
jgi:hypothetical protein